MSASAPFDLDSIRVLVITEGLHDVVAASDALEGAHRREARFAVLARSYEQPRAERIAFARALRGRLPRAVPVFYAGAPEEAREAEADGVHLGRAVATIAAARQVFGPEAWVSVPAHVPQDIAAAEREGAYAALVSPVLAVPGKGAPLGFSGLSCFVDRAAPRLVRTFALGGITSNDVRPCRRTGADGVAVTRAVWRAADPAAALVELAEAASRTD